MARFRGTVQGGRGTGSRLGHANTGLTTRANGWNGRIVSRLFVNKNTDEDWASVHHENASGVCTSLYHGPLNKWVNPRLERIEFIPIWDEHNPHG